MEIKKISPGLSVSPQISEDDIPLLAAAGFRSIVNNRPDGEEDAQIPTEALQIAAKRHGMDYHHLPVKPGTITNDDVTLFKAALIDMPGPVLAFCRTGTRSATLWALSQAGHLTVEAILETAKGAGYDLIGLSDRLVGRAQKEDEVSAGKSNAKQHLSRVHDVLVVGGGAGGLAVTASLLKRRSSLNIAVIEPRDEHYYQPGWTLVGGGIFDRKQTVRAMLKVMPKGAYWIRSVAAEFLPEENAVVLESGEKVFYKILIVSPGIKLDWAQVEGLEETLGENGVTSNYRFDLSPYTWELVRSLKKGRALFTQPPMPIKCAGAPQKAMYLACAHWLSKGCLSDIDVHFHTAGAALFGVSEYVPALKSYMKRYGAHLNVQENLIAINGPEKLATFEITDDTGAKRQERHSFDMIHICPPQTALDFMKGSAITDKEGWVEVNDKTLQHVKYSNVFGLGDGCSAPNAKTAAAVRKQAPTVAHNALAILDNQTATAIYDGYGSCPLTVERGKVVLAEFGYGGKLQPTFPTWLIDGTKASRLAWFLKEKLMPGIYFDLMLKGREWLAKPKIGTSSHDKT